METVSTYRIQFHKGFTFKDAAEIISYLHDLGITHLYASPYLKAVAGSMHGYDVIDHSQLNPEIGTADDYQQLVNSLAEHGMSQILDTVPNHMGVETNDNPWWNDVLTHGRPAIHANYFDIDWQGLGTRKNLAGKVLMPVLGETLAEAIDGGLLKLKSEGGDTFVVYRGGRRFPVDPRTVGDVPLESLLEKQNYRLIYWRAGADEINYRRFFDISGLAALQMQRPEVFEEVHRFTFSLIKKGWVDGLRVDHPDGLLDPKAYFDHLQEKYATECPNQSGAGKPLFVSVEKILNGDETLPEDWAVSGTSGYDFLYAVNDLFVDSANESAMTEIYKGFAGDGTSYADWVYREKRLVLQTSMYSEMETLVNRLDALAQQERSSHDFTRRQLHEALGEIIACFCVYRSYVSARGVSESDIEVVEQSVRAAAGRNAGISTRVLKFIQDSILQRYPVMPEVRGKQLDFAQRFQQLTSPVNAKGIEDSTFYIYNRLISQNEVGCDPGRFGRDSDAIHRYMAHRQMHWPLSLSALSTHDTKRSEDVRARINVLSEIPEEWEKRLDCWKQMNANIARAVHPNDQYLLYQTLIGAWPLEGDVDQTFVSRITAYMQKALREAKLRSCWTDPDEKYESAMTRLVASLLDPSSSGPFLDDFTAFQKRVSRIGLFNSLSQTVLRLTAPGIADTYQGSELWDFSLVDPDNRRPVNYDIRQKMLASMLKEPPTPESLCSTMEDGRIKLWVNLLLLQARKRMPELFLQGAYEALIASGSRAQHVFAFSRTYGDQILVVVVPRLLARLGVREEWQEAKWEDTRLLLPPDLTDLFTGSQLRNNRDPEMSVAQLLGSFPFTVLFRDSSGIR